MKKKFLIPAVLILSMLVFSSMALATPNASILYNETALGGGWWQYDYQVANTSDAGEYFYSMFLDFSSTANEEGLGLPTGWDGTVWMGTNTTAYVDTYSTASGNDLAAGSSLSGFSFKVDYQAGNVPYTAYFDDHAGNTYTTTGVTAPEPISSLLFLAGGATLVVRHYRKRKQLKSI